MRVGLMEEVGRLPGSMKLASDGGSPHSSVSSGVEKSDISLLKMIPVRIPRFLDPNLRKKKFFKSYTCVWLINFSYSWILSSLVELDT